MYTYLRSILPKSVCDWITACWFAFLIILIFVLWTNDKTGFHYLQM
ncbi:MAG: hypothetical protein WB783_03045 [Arenicellales bacterium]